MADPLADMNYVNLVSKNDHEARHKVHKVITAC